ncbi:MAG: glutamate-1-semialdehyde 2,1-aminomutase [Alphaproteobacteria bacterium]|nr:glutamate-1-semialdehyde 2,1-aminomutase [Alphaproteobacteria bacterium]|tara:strand:+ start:1667 stop:2998 length:1332 start_codon:yes stop_codon:yes gene_type:complete
MSSTTDATTNQKAIWDHALDLMPGGVSHPNRRKAGDAIYINRAEGSRMWDVEGNEYIDYSMGSASLLLGHAHPDVVKAIIEQAPLGTYTASCHPLEVEWAELVKELVPSAEQVRFVGTGSEATALAARVARAYTGKTKIIRFQGHYNGWSDVTITGSEFPYDEAPGAGVVPGAAEAIVVLPTDPERVEETLKTNDDIAGIMVEASGANWGSIPMPENFLQNLRDLADKYEVVLIFDEVITGFRWSPGGVQGLTGIVPDLSSMAKIVTGGNPGGALGGKSEIMEVLNPRTTTHADRKVVHKGTFNAAPIVAAPAVATLKIVKTGEPHKHANAMAEKMREGIRTILEEHQVAGAAYGESSTYQIHFGKTPSRDSVEGLSPEELRGVPSSTVLGFQQALLDRGVNNMSHFGGMLSSAHTDEDVEQTLKAIEGAIEELMAEGSIGRA